jgi:hypothetical protein
MAITNHVWIDTKDVAMVFEQLFDKLLCHFWCESENLVQIGHEAGHNLLDAATNNIDVINKLKGEVRDKQRMRKGVVPDQRALRGVSGQS